MKKILCMTVICLSLFQSMAQIKIEGIVTDAKGIPLLGVNVFLKGTYDGATTGIDGDYSFSTEETGIQELVASFISFETISFKEDVTEMKNLKIKLRENVNSLDAVVLSAGTFKAGDNSKVSVLKPLDVVTTASALGDPVAAFQTLPGTSTVAEDGRLFVRGGSAEETQIFVDGIRVFNPYIPTPNNTPTRGRFSPFLFDGMTFSTGGYSAEYGQALSGVLLLNTINQPDQEKTEIGIMSLGGGIGNTQIWDKQSLSINTSYINLAPYTEVFKDRNSWKKPYESISGETVYRYKFKDGIFKMYGAFDAAGFDVNQEDINRKDGVRVKLKNKNFYFNTSYKGVLENNWSVFGGLSYVYSKSTVNFIENHIDGNENSLHAKFRLKHNFSSRLKLNIGTEYFTTNFSENFSNESISGVNYGFQNNIAAVYSEFDIFFSKKLALKLGMRGEYTKLDKFSITPRMSFAYKVAENSQLSLAYGDFNQNPSSEVLKFTQDIKPQNTKHFILNYQYNKNGKIFRAETYYKNYDNLVKYDTEFTSQTTNFSNDGFGFAKGIDLFWRDNTRIKNLDYWVSYSYLDTRRDDRNFEKEAVPSFANKHNASIVAKYWVDTWKSQIGISHTFASGRSYTNPNKGGFLTEKTKPFHSLSFNWAYLISQQKILYFSVNNVLGTKNINGYQYADAPNRNGVFESRALRPAMDRFFFIGFFWTISEKGDDNQLNKF